ncbi:MAG: hypothetical protein KBA46_00045 [Candidatus Omnitrophica bacterium]|nr:hypothetical protein [Candidatus Omnitrophota bacterium]
MAEDIKGLIEKIQQEGIQQAEDRARQIEARAQQQADEIVKKAQAQVKQLEAEAEQRVAKMQDSAKVSLRQAARDCMLSLKQEITAMLQALIKANVKEALTSQELAKIIAQLVMSEYRAVTSSEIVIMVSKEDEEKLKGEFLTKLKQQIKQGVTLKTREDITAGFVISFDAGKSHFDFSDRAMSEYFLSQLSPALKELLQ